jgi:hypothetical protein
MSTAPPVSEKKNYRVPPIQALINNKASNTDAWCRYDPVSCLAQVGVETLFIAAAYSSVLLLLGNELPQITNIAKFMVMFSFLTFAARMISDTLSDKITITSLGALGSKVVTLMAPKIVTW